MEMGVAKYSFNNQQATQYEKLNNKKENYTKQLYTLMTTDGEI
jgi:hypothetical protein